MADTLEEIADGLWTVRGSFRIGGVVDIGTQASLVRVAPGRFVFLDSYALEGAVLDEVMALTAGGTAVEAILNVHPFHTVHCAAMHAQFPAARLYGSARHKRKAPDLPWERALVEGPAAAKRYAGVFDFSVPAGVDYISANEAVHFSSVLVRHVPTATLHVDDTLMALDLPWPARTVLPPERLGFHPTLAAALERRAGAAADFEAWANELGETWEVATVCAAHNAVARFEPGGFAAALRTALTLAQPVLRLHRWRYG